MKKILLSFLCLFFLISCGVSNSQNQALANKILDELFSCMKSSSASNVSRCAYNFHQNIKSQLNDNDPYKPALMIYSTKIYVLFSNYEKRKISQEDVKIGLMKADSELSRDAQVIARQTAEDRRQQLIYQQQMFNNAAQLLRGDGGGQINCYSTPGVPGNFYCR